VETMLLCFFFPGCDLSALAVNGVPCCDHVPSRVVLWRHARKDGLRSFAPATARCGALNG